MWLTAFSQLVSRICHPSKEVQNTLCTILVKLILAYPQHCLWMMASVFKVIFFFFSCYKFFLQSLIFMCQENCEKPVPMFTRKISDGNNFSDVLFVADIFLMFINFFSSFD